MHFLSRIFGFYLQKGGECFVWVKPNSIFCLVCFVVMLDNYFWNSCQRRLGSERNPTSPPHYPLPGSQIFTLVILKYTARCGFMLEPFFFNFVEQKWRENLALG